jgi:hypothetical protein
MPLTYDLTTGGQLPTPSTPLAVADGGVAPVLQPLVQFKVNLPDTYSGQNVTFAGKISPVVSGQLQPSIVMTGSPIALPAVPSSGLTTKWALQVNLTTGVVTMLQNTGTSAGVAAPAASAGCLIIMQSATVNGDTIPWTSGVSAATTLGTAPTFIDLN